MTRLHLLLTVWLLSFVVAGPAPRAAAEEPPTGGENHAKPWFVDDEKFFGDFMDKLMHLARDGKCLAHDKLLEKMDSGKKAKVKLTSPGKTELTPGEIYLKALPSVFMIGSVHKLKDGEKEKAKDKEKDKQLKEGEKERDWQEGLYATAWVASADGVLVTNWHVFDDLEEDEVFGAVDYQGNVYPVIDFLGGDKVADVAIVKIAAKGLKPLPLAEEYAQIGSWVGVLGHPGDNYFVYTQGFVTRYSTNKNDDGKREHWMGLTAEYAGGSSGSPVLDHRGNVVGMAALTLTIDGAQGEAARTRRAAIVKEPPLKAPPPHDKLEPKDIPKLGEKPGSTVQMILKMAVPSPTIGKLFSKP